MTAPFASYVLCGTPRSGTTLLCGMLAATGVAGRPNSYFRGEDIAEWAEAWGVPTPRGTDAPGFDSAFLDAMRREGAAGTGVFGLRLMWASAAEAARRLDRALGERDLARGGARDLAQGIEAAFGPTLYVHVSREDKVAQAVSRLRAEQSGVWHLAADGSVLEGVETPRPTSFYAARIAELVQELESDEASWAAFFEARGIAPLRLDYEDVARGPSAALARILAALGLDPRRALSVPIPTSRTADEVSRAWVERFRREARARRARLPPTRR